MRVIGCYDRDGELTGSVTGNLLRATGKSLGGGIPSTFVLTVTENGDLVGVRSTNGAPFQIYSGVSTPALRAEFSTATVTPPGCGAIVHGINFDYDPAAIRPESTEMLDTLLAGLQDAPESLITIVGHTSSEGSAAYNQELSQRRAEAVVAALMARGLDSSRLTARGAGEQQPIADNATEAGRSLNRRVVVECC